jgi:multimeric flavodoxin WrbA
MDFKTIAINFLRKMLPPETVEIRLKPVKKFQGPIKILAINGSGRGSEGGSAKMLNEFVEHVKKFGGEVKIVHLAEKPIEPCEGCVSKGEGFCTYPCIHEYDYTSIILKDMIDADAFVFVTPNYWAGVSSHIQSLLEKMTAIEENHYKIAFENGREPLLGKPAVLLCSQEGEGAAMVLSRLSWALSHMGIWVLPWGMIFKPALLNKRIVRLGMRMINEQKFEWIDNTIRACARNLVLATRQLKDYQWDDYDIIEPNC